MELAAVSLAEVAPAVLAVALLAVALLAVALLAAVQLAAWRGIRSGAGGRSATGCQPGTVALVAASARTALPAGLEFNSLNLKGIQLGCSKVGLLAKSYVAYALYIHLFKL